MSIPSTPGVGSFPTEGLRFSDETLWMALGECVGRTRDWRTPLEQFQSDGVLQDRVSPRCCMEDFGLVPRDSYTVGGSLSVLGPPWGSGPRRELWVVPREVLVSSPVLVTHTC